MRKEIVKLTENDFFKQVIDLGHLYGWKIAHFRTSMTQSGRWATAVQADGAGFPDLVLARDTLILVELKSENGKLSEAQLEWQEALEGIGVDYYVWRPSNWDEILERLR